MDTFESITTKFDVREFSGQDVKSEIKLKIIEAARSSGTGLNTQHWRFIVVENKDNLKKLAEDRSKRKLGCRCQLCRNSIDKSQI